MRFIRVLLERCTYFFQWLTPRLFRGENQYTICKMTDFFQKFFVTESIEHDVDNVYLPDGDVYGDVYFDDTQHVPDKTTKVRAIKCASSPCFVSSKSLLGAICYFHHWDQQIRLLQRAKSTSRFLLSNSIFSILFFIQPPI